MSNRREVFKHFEKYKEYTDDRINNGIESARKGWAEINLTDEEGKPIVGAKVTASQKTHQFKYGANLFMLDEMETDEKNRQYKEYFKQAFNMATLPFYWSDLEPEKGAQRYDKNSPKIYRRPAIDLCMEFCEQNGIEPREHALAYEHFFPKWLAGKDDNTVKREYIRRCKEISERYADKIPTIEVTNEMMWNKGQTDFYKGPDYIAWCFKTTEEYFPANQLVINEWSPIWITKNECSIAYYLMIENALLKGARIDAVGMQFHMFNKREHEPESAKEYYNPRCLYDGLDKFAQFNLPIQITEVTVPAYSDSEEDESVQAELIERFYSIWFSHPNVEQIIYWNLVDGYAAWAPQGDMTVGENYYYGGLIRHDLTPKPAYYTVKRLFEEKWRTNENLSTDCDGTASFKGFYGKYDITVEYNGQIYKKNIDLAKNRNNIFDIKL